MSTAASLRALRAYTAAFSLFLLWMSATSIIRALAGRPAHAGRALLLTLAGLEFAAAAALPFAPLRRAACGLLIAVFTLACAVTVLHEHLFPAPLLFDLCTALFILALSSRLKGAVP